MRILDLIENPEYKEKFVLQKFIGLELNLERNDIRNHAEDELTDTQYENILSNYTKYAIDKMPMEYILGHVDFFEKSFEVNEHTLIPRPETEYMIQAVSEHTQANIPSNKKNLLLDIGTGSWVLGTSVLIQNPDTFDHVIMTDISNDTLQVAQRNFSTHITQHDYPVEFINSSLLDFIQKENHIALHDFENIILISNAPYIPDNTLDTEVQESVKLREPRVALVGGDDGLDLYRIMLDQLIPMLPEMKTSGSQITLFFEMMTRQCDILAQAYTEHFDFSEVKTFHANIRIIKASPKH